MYWVSKIAVGHYGHGHGNKLDMVSTIDHLTSLQLVLKLCTLLPVTVVTHRKPAKSPKQKQYGSQAAIETSSKN